MNVCLRNYSFTYNESLFAVFTLTGGVLVQRHWQASLKIENIQAKWGHRIIAIIEAVPFLGGLSAFIEIVAIRCLGKGPYLIPSPGKRVNKREFNFRSSTPLEREEYQTKINVYTHDTAELDIHHHSSHFDNSYKQVGMFKILEKKCDDWIFDLREIYEDPQMCSKYNGPKNSDHCLSL